MRIYKMYYTQFMECSIVHKHQSYGYSKSMGIYVDIPF